MLDALAGLMNGGSVEILSDTQRVLATLRLSNSVCGRSDGSEVLACDVGDENSDATIKLTPQKITAGAPVRIQSFKLAMP